MATVPSPTNTSLRIPPASDASHRLQIVRIDQQHVLACACIEGVAADSACEPVGGVITGQRVVPDTAIKIIHSEGGGIHRLARGRMGDIGRGPAVCSLGHDLGAGIDAVLLSQKSMTVGVGQEIRRLGLTSLPADDKVAGGQNLVAAVDQTVLRRGSQVDAGDAQLGERLEFALVDARLIRAIVVHVLEAQAVSVVVDPHAERVPRRIGAGEEVVVVRVHTLERRKPVRKRFGAGVAPSPHSPVVILRQRLRHVIDDAVAVQIVHHDPVGVDRRRRPARDRVRRDPARLLLAAPVVIDIEEDDCVLIGRQLHPIPIQIEHQRVNAIRLEVQRIAVGAHDGIDLEDIRERAPGRRSRLDIMKDVAPGDQLRILAGRRDDIAVRRHEVVAGDRALFRSGIAHRAVDFGRIHRDPRRNLAVFHTADIRGIGGIRRRRLTVEIGDSDGEGIGDGTWCIC